MLASIISLKCLGGKTKWTHINKGLSGFLGWCGDGILRGRPVVSEKRKVEIVPLNVRSSKVDNVCEFKRVTLGLFLNIGV